VKRFSLIINPAALRVMAKIPKDNTSCVANAPYMAGYSFAVNRFMRDRCFDIAS